MASPETLMNQAASTVDYYLQQAIASVSDNLTDEYLEKNPQIISELVKCMVLEYQANYLAQEIRCISDTLLKISENISDSIIEAEIARLRKLADKS
jgi:hypothetical protein